MPKLYVKQSAWLILALLVVLLDQWTKIWVLGHYAPYQIQPVMPSLNLTLAFNRGSAFSFLSSASGWQRWFFTGFALLVSMGLVVWLLRTDKTARWQSAGIALILGGAIGNVWDRIAFGYVIDFIDVYVGKWHWPVFNLADSAITLGVILLIVSSFRQNRKTLCK